MRDFTVILLIFSAVTTTILGISVLLKGPRKTSNRLLCAISLSGTFWIFTNTMADTSNNAQTAIFWVRAAFIGPIIILPLWVWFSVVFPAQKRKLSAIKIILFSLPALLSSFSIPGSLNIKAAKIEEWGVSFTPGPFYPVMLFVIVAYIVVGVYNLLNKYKIVDVIGKAQIRYVVIGVLFSYVIGTTTNLVLPTFFIYSRASIFGPISTLIFVGSVAYAIMRYELLEIKPILAELLVGIFLVLLLMQFFVPSLVDLYIWKVLLIMVFIIFGYLFIKSIHKETEDKERIKKLDAELIEKKEKLREAHWQVAEERAERLERVFMDNINLKKEIEKLEMKIESLNRKIRGN